jgi:branched-chain amino acid transport system substrate-binding protein
MMLGWAPVRTRAISLCACLSAIALAGCSTQASGGKSAVTVTGTSLTVYASQPPGGSGGQAAADTLAAEQLALQQAGGKAGNFTVKLIKLTGAEISDNARTAIQNKTTIAYLGELQPGTSQISVEILNQQGVLVVSPADTAVYLTQATPSVPDSPNKFYPSRSTYQQTFARVVPNTAEEAEAQVQQMKTEGASHLYVADDGQPYGTSIAAEVAHDARQAGISVTQGAAAGPLIRQAGADALFYGSSEVSAATGKQAAALLSDAVSESPNLKLFLPSGLSDPDFASALDPSVQKQVIVSSPGFLPQDLTASGRQFESAFQTAFGHKPATQAIFGYEAMSALLSVISSQGSSANNRANIVKGFRGIKNRQSVIGTYSINGGDPSIAPFVFAKVRGGQLIPFRFLQVQG